MKLKPLRVMTARAPSGGESYFCKYSESDQELSWQHGRLSGKDEEAVFWRAKLAAEKPGIDQWQKAAKILSDSGWQVVEDAT